MDIYIPKEQMPKYCGECPCVYISDYQVCCQALAVDIYTDDIDILHERLPNCPLKVIEQWRLESCSTCGVYGCVRNADVNYVTCSCWQGKVK